jgi:hypothetical protein
MCRGTVARDQIVVDGLPVDLVDPALCTPSPTASDALRRPDVAAAAATVLPPSGELLAAITNLLPSQLSGEGVIDALVACDRLRALIDSRQVELLAELRQRDLHGAEFLQDAVALARHLAPGTAAVQLETASELTGRLWDTFELVRDGRLPVGHARHLASACRDLTDEVTAKVQDQVLPRAYDQTPGEFKAAVRKAIAKHDSADLNQRHRKAVEQRHVFKEADLSGGPPANEGVAGGGGMGWLNLFTAVDGIETVWTAVNAWAVTTEPGDSRTMDQRRADALVDICSAALAMPGLPTAHGLRPAVNVTLAASTLAGADDQPGYVNGEPFPADVARRLAALPGARFHSWLVDATGRILDKTCPNTPEPLWTDRYQPTARIARHVTIRDQRCIVPGCRRPAYQCQLDHRRPWPDGETSVENLQPLCKRHHDMKHSAGWTVNRLGDGSYEWLSPTRHRYRYRPPEHPVPTEQPATPPAEDDDPPPY